MRERRRVKEHRRSELSQDRLLLFTLSTLGGFLFVLYRVLNVHTGSTRRKDGEGGR